eukprot:TRINITY_DN457_c0_g1_i1.p1 TRINITY_DN457_c0_g1~~TRINITY_DN457_c0_g1_i1.p1  ORF type:complete len:117 (-),score=29.21 TRINITY_DN457_c0_g1_i1:61-411(-)
MTDESPATGVAETPAPPRESTTIGDDKLYFVEPEETAPDFNILELCPPCMKKHAEGPYKNEIASYLKCHYSYEREGNCCEELRTLHEKVSNDIENKLEFFESITEVIKKACPNEQC